MASAGTFVFNTGEKSNTTIREHLKGNNKSVGYLDGQRAKKEMSSQRFYCSLRTNFLLLKIVREIEFNMDCSGILISLCPKMLAKYGLSLGSH